MKYNRHTLVFRTLLLMAGASAVAPQVFACAFCDEGANQAALFMVIVFGLMMTAMGFICFSYYRSGAFKTSAGIENRVLEVEGVEPGESGEEDHS